MSTQYFYIKVLGEIIAEGDTPQYAQNWVCGSIGGEPSDEKFSYNEKEHIVESDLILNSDTRSVPYAFYYTEKGIRGRHIVAWPGGGGAYSYFLENMSSIRAEFNNSITKADNESLYNWLFINSFSTLELFLSDLILSYIFSSSECYSRAREFFISENKKCKQTVKEYSDEELIGVIRNYFFNYVYHRFDKVQAMFNSILGDCFPDFHDLNKHLRRRNNLVHRSSMDGLSRMQNTRATREAVSEIIEVTSQFSANLIQNLSLLEHVKAPQK